ncbi:hypothetical protein CQW23_05335 [Capsicum baccatum]|uniref:Reverse transcriptase domain-containing protein n=1 Tax=Capsicum baccatum TaxID=33114 RepID=A0A2G2XHB2_CAPBA|nr:hypothetical protein CQW23_05335 [Capsicum baccatum]
MEIEEGEEITEIGDEMVIDSTELLTMTGHKWATDEEGAILLRVSGHAMNDISDFWTMRVTVSVKGKFVQVSLREIQLATMNMIQQNDMDKLLAKPTELCMMFVGVLKEYNQDGTSGSLLFMEPAIDECSHQEDLTPLLDQYNDLFEVPKGLPLAKEQDHKITFQEGTSPINIRPYRYPIIQKDEIEKMVDEMLELGVIRHSTSPFSSPIVMVKKKDGSWRMCVNYRELNNHTIKDKFPIPVIEELLD